MLLGGNLGEMTDAQVQSTIERWEEMNRVRAQHGLAPLPVPDEVAVRNLASGEHRLESRGTGADRVVTGTGMFSDPEIESRFTEPLQQEIAPEIRQAKETAKREERAAARAGNGGAAGGGGGFPWLLVGGGVAALGLGWFIFGRRR